MEPFIQGCTGHHPGCDCSGCDEIRMMVWEEMDPTCGGCGVPESRCICDEDESDSTISKDFPPF